MTYFISGHRDLTWGLSDEDVMDCVKRGICKVNFATELRAAYSKAVKDPSLDRELLLRKLASLRLKSMISIEEYEYLRHLIRKENENAQRANGCTY